MVVLRIIVIKSYSAGGFPLEEASELGFISIKCINFGVVILYILLFHSYLLEYFYFFIIIIHTVPYN